MNRLIFATLCASLFSQSQTHASELESLIKRTLKWAVVKVVVSANEPVFDAGGNNLCNSAGTAFLVSGEYAVTAYHVLQIDPGCKGVVVLLRSFPAKKDWIATLVDTAEDVALLKFDRVTSYRERLCSLVVGGAGFEHVGMKFGIPGDLMIDPPGTEIDIGAEDGGFKPLATITPAITERGESGGPVIYNMTVAGLIKARHPNYPAYSFMIPNAAILELMEHHQVGQDGTECNPVFASISASGKKLQLRADSGPLAETVFSRTALAVLPSPSAWNEPPFRVSTEVTETNISLSAELDLPFAEHQMFAEQLSEQFKRQYLVNLWDAYEAEVWEGRGGK